MELLFIVAAISVGLNIWLLRKNNILSDRVSSLIDELAKVELGF